MVTCHRCFGEPKSHLVIINSPSYSVYSQALLPLASNLHFNQAIRATCSKFESWSNDTSVLSKGHTSIIVTLYLIQNCWVPSFILNKSTPLAHGHSDGCMITFCIISSCLLISSKMCTGTLRIGCLTNDL